MVRPLLEQLHQAAGILAEAVGEALVGEVEQRQCPGLAECIGDGRPLLRRGVDAGGVVAAAVQHHDVTSRHGAQHADQGIEVELPIGAQVGVAADSHPGGLEDLGMVGPGGRGQPHRCPGVQGVDEVARHPQGAGPARRMQQLHVGPR